MADGTTSSEIKPPAARVSKRRYNFPKAIDRATQEYESRVREVRAILMLLEQHVTSPPNGEIDQGIVSGAVDAAIRTLDPVESLSEPLDLERQGKALLEKDRG